MTTSSTSAGKNPFVGPLPLETGRRIFARDREIEELYYLLSAERIVLLHSPSGAGKTSLIRAGLIPRLAERFDVRGPTRVNTQPPEGATVNRYVRSANLGFEQGLPEERRRAEHLVSSMTLAEYVEGRPRRRSAPQNVVLIFDQFEEILTADPLAFDAKREYFRQLGELLQNPRIWALFALREDYLPQLDPYADRIPTHLKNRFRVDLLSRAAAQEVMAGTAKEGGRTFAQDAVEKLVTDLATMKVQQPDGSFESRAGPHVEPLYLQVACRGLWERMPAEHRTIDPKDVERFGNVTDALASYYGNSVAGLAGGSDVVERAIREWVDKRLIPPDGIRRQVLRGKDKSEGLDNKLISELVNTHLVRAEQRAGAVWFELSHDRLIEPVRASNRHWFDAKLHSFQKIAAVWEAQNRPDGLLFVGAAFDEAKRWAEANGALVTDSERSFLEKSREKQRAVERELEAERAKAEAQGRYAQRMRWAAVVSGTLALVAVVGVVMAVWNLLEAKSQQARAQTAQKEAQASLWVANSRAELRDNRVEKAIEYAARAFEGLPTEATRSALASALFELSPHLEATFNFGTTTAEAIAWTNPDSVVYGTGNDGGQLRTLSFAKALPTAMATDRPMPRLTRVQDGNPAAVRAVRAIGPDRVVAVFDNGALAISDRGATAARVWAPSPLSPPATLYATAHAAAISRSGTLIVTAGNGSDVTLLECAMPAGAQTSPDCRPHALANVRGRAVAISPDETRVAVADEMGVVSIYDRAGLRIGEPIAVGGTLLALGWAEARDWLAAGNSDGDIMIIDVGAPTRPQIAKASFAGAPITTLAWSPQGLGLAFACDGRTVCFWPGAAGADGAARFAPIRRFEGHINSVTRLAWSAGGDHIASASVDGSIRVWSLAQNTDAGLTLYAESSARIAKVATSPDGRRVVGGAMDGTIRIWDAASGSLLRTAKSSYDSEVAALAWTRSGLLAAAHEGRGITLVPADEQKPVPEIAIDADMDTCIVFVEDDKTIAMPLRIEKRIALIDVGELGSAAPSGSPARRYIGDTDATIGPDQVPWGLAADPAGKTLFASYSEANGTIRIWDVGSLKLVGPMAYTLSEMPDPVAAGSLSVSRDGRWLATSGGDNFIRVYDVVQRKSWRALPMDLSSNEPRNVAFSPDGTKLAALAADNRVYVWSLREDGAERYAVFKATPNRSAVANAEKRAQLASWLAWVSNDSIALATGASAINVIGLDSAKWRRRVEGLLVPSATSPIK